MYPPAGSDQTNHDCGQKGEGHKEGDHVQVPYKGHPPLPITIVRHRDIKTRIRLSEAKKMVHCSDLSPVMVVFSAERDLTP